VRIDSWYPANALLGAAAAGLIPILLPLFVAASAGSAEVGLVMAAFSLGGLSAPLWGALADRRRLHRPLLSGGLLALAAGAALMPLASSFPVWLVLAFLQSIGLAAASTVANLFVVEAHPRPEWDARIGWLQTFYGAGQVAGLLLAGALGPGRSRGGLWIAGGLCALAVVPILLAAPKLPGAALLRRPVLLHPARHAEWPPVSPQRMYHHLDLRAIRWLRSAVNARLIVFLFAWLVSFGGSAAFFALYPILMRQAYGLAPGLSAAGFAASAAAGLALYTPAGRWSARRGPEAVLRAGLAARLGAFLALWGITRIPVRLRGLPAAACFLVVVLAWSALSVAGTARAAQLSSAAEGEGLGVFSAVTALAGVLGSAAGGWAAGRWGYQAVPVVSLAGVAAGLLLLVAVRGSRREAVP
jgi:DHA1 family tetracycline resistance protein-like MFS transporter